MSKKSDKSDKDAKVALKDKESKKAAKENKEVKDGKKKGHNGNNALEALSDTVVLVTTSTENEDALVSVAPQEEANPAQAYLAKMQAERGYILGWHKILAERDFDFLQGYNSLLEAAYTTPRLLDPKTKEMLITAVLMAVRSLPDHIKTHLELCKKLGVTEQEMLEVLELILPPAGVPAFMHSFDLWKQVYNVD